MRLKEAKNKQQQKRLHQAEGECFSLLPSVCLLRLTCLQWLPLSRSSVNRRRFLDAALHVAEQRVSVASACSRLVCRLIWRPVAVGGAFLLLISSTSELSQTESVTAKSLVGLSNG